MDNRERIIFNSHHIVQIIFKHLNARSLNTCAQVCTLWNRIAVAEKNRRVIIHTFFKVGACHNTEIRRQIELCPIINHSVREAELFQELKNIRIEPVFCMTFMSVPLFAKFQEYFPSSGPNEHEEKRRKLSAAIIKRYSYVEENYGASAFIAENAPIKALLVFSTSKGARAVNKLIERCRSDDESLKMAVGGAIVEGTECFEGSFVAFSGPNVEAGSIIININDKKEEITAKFETFKETAVKTAFKNFLPDKCKFTFTVATGIVGCNADCVPMEIENGPAMSGIFIPKMEGVTINKCCLNKKNFNASEFIAQNAPIKALLVFPTLKGTRTVDDLIERCRSDDGSLKMAVGGAIVELTECFVGSVVAFSGPNVEAGSIIINMNDKKEEITAKFETFKETGLLNHKCFAFMFAYDGRGYSFHQEHNVESSIFCKMYPNIPLIGLFGKGEVGYNYLPNFPMEKTLKAGSFARYEKNFYMVILLCLY
ncbi:hypothetical protein TNIN_435421 [Trichonephila inaurata madagascariensis]|uniref:F-box domain-containing protein n=1 Tax=Trichonephila inaurata madagascariensis TaxID=2747483 RepID=A0A8X6WR11_9ARAC|nr:hypothetical protein TNIN_435421 [Trichonephila inaurata madagascariensis]